MRIAAAEGCRKMAKQDPSDEDTPEGCSGRSSLPLFSPLRYAAFIGASLFLAGCATGGKPIDQAMQADKGRAAARSASVGTRYLVGCPDVLEVQVDGVLVPGAQVMVGPDGRVDLTSLGSLRVEGQTVSEIAQA